MKKNVKQIEITRERLAQRAVQAQQENNGQPVDLRAKFAAAATAMKAALVERDSEVDLVLIALVCREHVLLVGPPGCGKSLLLDSLMGWMRATKFETLMTKFSTPEEVCGPVSVSGLKTDGFYRITAGMLPEAEIAFVDEFFKANSAIANTLLKILNERTFKNGTKGTVACPLRLLVAASNEYPDDSNGGKELGAILDRFLFRKTVRYSSKRGLRDLLGKAVSGDKCRAAFADSITPAEVDQAANEAAAMPFGNAAKKALWQILEELGKEGIRPSDRRIYKAVGAARAAAYLAGATEVQPMHLEVLAHVLWDDPTEQPEKTAKVVGRIANPTGMKVTELLVQIESVMDQSKPTEAVPKLQAIEKEIYELAESIPYTDARITAAGDYCKDCIRRSYNSVINRKEEN